MELRFTPFIFNIQAERHVHFFVCLLKSFVIAFIAWALVTDYKFVPIFIFIFFFERLKTNLNYELSRILLKINFKLHERVQVKLHLAYIIYL